MILWRPLSCAAAASLIVLLIADHFDCKNNTLRLRFPNSPDGVTVEVRRQPGR